MSSVIYRIRNVVNAKFYIGSTTNKKVRFNTHRRQLRSGKSHNPHLQNAWNKYGEDAFKFEVIEEIAEGIDIFKAEDVWLKKHHGKEHCYNIAEIAGAPDHTGHTHSSETRALISQKVQKAVAEGRGGCFIPDEETRQKMSDSLKGNKNCLGVRKTDEQKEAIRQRTLGNQNWLGKRHSDESRAKTGKPIIEMTTGKEFAVMNDAVKFYKMANLATILRSIDTGFPLSKGPNAGLQFTYVDGERPEQIESEYPTSRPEAMRTGATHYFTGRPCKRGHVALRVVKGTCVECRKEDWTKTNEKNKNKPKSEAAKAAGRRYYERNKELVKARAKARV